MKSGFIILDKPEGKTSHDMVNFVRHLLNTRRVGHTGTLDPMATGVLPICAGSATKAADMLTMSDKRYRARFKLGLTTDTQDISGKILATHEVNISDNEIRAAILSFLGEYDQLPPMYSAIKKDGKKLYELAREGKTVEREKRRVNIKELDIINVSDEIEIDVLCSKGTYIRTLCADIGKKLGTGAVMTALRRTQTGGFAIHDSHTCEELTKAAQDGSIDEFITPVDLVFDYEKLRLTPNQTKSVKNGVIMTYHKPDGLYRVYDSENNFICIGRVKDEKIKVEKSFWT